MNRQLLMAFLNTSEPSVGSVSAAQLLSSCTILQKAIDSIKVRNIKRGKFVFTNFKPECVVYQLVKC